MFWQVTQQLLEGFESTLKLFCITLVAALPLGLIISFGSMSKFRPLKWLCKTLIWIIRGTPLVLQMIIVYYGPGLVGNWAQNLENPNAFITWLAGWTVFDRFVAADSSVCPAPTSNRMKTLPSPPTPRSGKRPNGRQKADAPGSGCTLPLRHARPENARRTIGKASSVPPPVPSRISTSGCSQSSTDRRFPKHRVSIGRPTPTRRQAKERSRHRAANWF